MRNNFFKTMPIFLSCLLMLTACNNSKEIKGCGSSDTIVNSTSGSYEGSNSSTENSGNSADSSNSEGSSTNEASSGNSQSDSQGNSSNDSSSSTTENSTPEKNHQQRKLPIIVLM